MKSESNSAFSTFGRPVSYGGSPLACIAATALPQVPLKCRREDEEPWARGDVDAQRRIPGADPVW